jgi:hypothetical protein
VQKNLRECQGAVKQAGVNAEVVSVFDAAAVIKKG